MSDRRLSSSEAEQLLAQRRARARMPAEISSLSPSVGRASHRPIPAGTLATLHELFARRCEVKLTEALRTPVQLALASLEIEPGRQFIAQSTSISSLVVARCDQSTEPLLLEFSPSILFPVIDRLLGGGQEPSPTLLRPLTDIEQRLLQHTAELCLSELSRAWEDVAQVTFTVERVEPVANSSAGRSSSLVAHLTFDIGWAGATGSLRIALPAAIANRLQPDFMPALAGHAPTMSGPSVVGVAARSDGPSDVRVHLADSTISADELADLQPGDILTTSHAVDAPVIVSVDGAPKFLARLGALQGRKAARVEGPIEPRS